MRIGIDARNLLVPTTGIGRYIIGITGGLLRQGADITLYWPEQSVVAPDGLEGVRHRSAAFRGGVGRLVWTHTRLPRDIRRDPPDIFWGPAHRLPPLLKGAVPAAVTIHDLVWHRFPQTMRRRGLLADRLLMRHAITRADHIFAVSHATASDVTALFGKDRPVSVIHPGVTELGSGAAGQADPARLARYGIDRPYALFVGSREPRKNLDRLIDAFVAISTRPGRPRLLVIAGGEGWRGEAIRAALTSAGATGNVRVTGYVSDADLAMLYAGARLLAMPSLYEGFGLPVIEAQRYGVPALVSTAGALPEAAGEGGLAVEATDTAAIAQALYDLFEDDALHARLGASARANVARFSWDDSARQMLALFAAMRRDAAR